MADHIDRGEGFLCDHCKTKIERGEMYYRFHRRTGWYSAHSDLHICNEKRENKNSKLK